MAAMARGWKSMAALAIFDRSGGQGGEGGGGRGGGAAIEEKHSIRSTVLISRMESLAHGAHSRNLRGVGVGRRLGEIDKGRVILRHLDCS